MPSAVPTVNEQDNGDAGMETENVWEQQRRDHKKSDPDH
jgi:hypothetical protein